MFLKYNMIKEITNNVNTTAIVLINADSLEEKNV